MDTEKIAIDYVPTSSLRPAEYNPRRADDKQSHDLTESIKRFGIKDPIIVNRAKDRKNVIIGGHFRHRVAQALGYKEVPVVYVNIPELEREKELNLRLNRNLGAWDFDLLADFDEDMLKDVGFDSAELDKIFQLDTDEADDEIPENIPAIAKKGEIYQLGRHKIMCGDATSSEDVAKLMGGKQADMVFTDPPYGVSYSKKNEFLNQFDTGNRNQREIENDQKNEEDIQIFWKKSFENIRDILAPVNSYYINGPQIQGMMMMMMMMEAGLPYRHVIIWVKNNHVLGRCDYNYKHEPIFFGWTKKHKFYGNGEFRTSVWEVPKPHKSDLHPTMKPIQLIVNALQNSSQRDSICFDPFLGSGSTLIACEKTNRICYGMEIDPHYVDVIIKRYEDFTKQKARKING